MQITNLRLKFPGESGFIFKDLTFHIPDGQKVLLLGPSGCGKSTLLQVLSGLIPRSLEVPMKAESIALPHSWGFVFQDPDTQFCMPYVDEELAFVLENLRVPREEMDVRIERVLSSVGLALDDKHTLIHNLSQGMKQRLALASVLLLEPQVLFLDEPSALLDPEGTMQIWEAVKQVANDKTVVIVEHKIEQIVDWIDRVILFNATGEILADGLPQQVFRQYRAELQSYGVWYPGVWEDYIQSAAYRRLMADREQAAMTQTSSDAERANAPALLGLVDFVGYQGNKEKIKVREAEVHTGDWIAIVGKNGAGKTTLLQSLIQLLRTSGTYLLQGKPVNGSRKRKNRTLPQGLALVFQNPELQFVADSIFEELAFSLREQGPLNEDAEAKVRALLSAFHLEISERRHPYQLSIGQKRRLSVATAVVQEQQLLLLDEPTFGQDARNTFAILEMLERLRIQGTTILMVTHDDRIVEYFATQVWKVEQGELTVTRAKSVQQKVAVHA